MLLTSAMKTPRAELSGQALSWEEAQRLYKGLFLSGGELEATKNTAERLSPIAGAHRILTNSFGAIPFGVFQKVDGSRVPVSDEALDWVLKVRPNVNMSPFLCGKVWLSNAFWHGWGAVWNRRNERGEVVERIPLPTDCMSVRRDQETGLYWYDCDVEGVRRTFGSYELSILFFESYDGIAGRGLLALARETIPADGMAQRYAKKFYQNGARLSGILEVDTHADSKTRNKLKAEFSSYAGDDAFKVAVVDHGMKFTPLGLSQADAQFIESRSFTVEEVARFTGVPKYMLQTGKEAYDSDQQQRVDFVTDTLMPYILQREQEGSFKELNALQRRAGWYIHGNPSVLLRGDDASRSQFYERMIRNSIYCPDECRSLEEKPPIPGGLGKEFLVTKNLGGLSQVLKGEG